MKKAKIHRGWHISRDPFDKNQLQAVKGKMRITGSIEQIIITIDKWALDEMRRELEVQE